MSLNYLGKNRPIFFDDTQPCAQLIQFVGIRNYVKCAFCHYNEPFRTSQEFVACYKKRGCGIHDLLFMPMVTDAFGAGGNPNNFVYTPFFKQHTTNYIKRYLQLIQCSLQGYQCNKLCQFYPSRIDSQQSVSDCASSHACGRNGSFWTLLTPLYPQLDNWEFVDVEHTSPLPIQLLDGTLLNDVTVTSITRAANGHLEANLSNGNSYYIAALSGETFMNGYLLDAPINDYPELWHPGSTRWDKVAPSKVALLYWIWDPIWLALENAGWDYGNLSIPMKYLTYVQITPSVGQWFYSYRGKFELIQNDETYIVVIENARATSKYAISFNAGHTTLLGCRINSKTPSDWVKVNKAITLPDGVSICQLSAYNDSMAQWLRTIGVKASLFNSLSA